MRLARQQRMLADQYLRAFCWFCCMRDLQVAASSHPDSSSQIIRNVCSADNNTNRHCGLLRAGTRGRRDARGHSSDKKEMQLAYAAYELQNGRAVGESKMNFDSWSHKSRELSRALSALYERHGPTR